MITLDNNFLTTWGSSLNYTKLKKKHNILLLVNIWLTKSKFLIKEGTCMQDVIYWFVELKGVGWKLPKYFWPSIFLEILFWLFEKNVIDLFVDEIGRLD